ncbi:MAG: hypothetical protein H0V96_11950 [Acidimicrobiia bacterium]|nr:hypothetical protein [Acidimicrobiia bacterium]
MTIPARSSFWDLIIGDPGPNNLFAGAVYDRGATTPHVLRLTIGDAFFPLLRRWATTYRGDNVTTDQLIAMAEDISGQDLDELFDVWLFTPTSRHGPSSTRRCHPGTDSRWCCRIAG